MIAEQQTPLAEPLLHCTDIAVRFGGVAALGGVSLAVAPGAIHGVIGPNGAGKTTLFNVLSGIIAPTEGRVSYAGTAIGGLPAHAVAARGVARTFQNIRLFDRMSVTENILIGRHRHFKASLPTILFRRGRVAQEEEQAHAEAGRLVAYCGLAGLEDHAAANLSYGYKRRLEIARALAVAPRLLLLDEPMAGMNPAEKQNLSALIRRIRDDGTTVLVIEHDMTVMMTLCERITVLHHGRTIGDGTPAEIRADKTVIDAYLGQPEGPSPC